MEFPELTKTVKKIEYETAINVVQENVLKTRINNALKTGSNKTNLWSGMRNGSYTAEEAISSTDCKKDRPRWFSDGRSFASISSRSFRRGWGARSISSDIINRRSW